MYGRLHHAGGKTITPNWPNVEVTWWPTIWSRFKPSSGYLDQVLWQWLHKSIPCPEYFADRYSGGVRIQKQCPLCEVQCELGPRHLLDENGCTFIGRLFGDRVTGNPSELPTLIITAEPTVLQLRVSIVRALIDAAGNGFTLRQLLGRLGGQPPQRREKAQQHSWKL
jgi:hypothetical protein